jgi:hypothetical protein
MGIALARQAGGRTLSAGNQGKRWTATAAARAARDARIAAVSYQRDCETERLWHAAVLRQAHEARARNIDSGLSWALLLASMGYAPPYPIDWQELAGRVLTDEAELLAAAYLYIMTPQMLDVVIAAAQTLTRGDLALITGEDPPAPSGAVILPRPLRRRTPDGGAGEQELAYSWHSPASLPLPEQGGFELAELPAIRMSAYSTSRRANRDFREQARLLRIQLPPILLDCVWHQPLHATTPAQARDQDRWAEHLLAMNASYWAGRPPRAADPDAEVSAEYASGEVLDEDADGTFGSRFLYAFWRLCEQRIALADQPEPGHSAKLAAAQAGVDPEVRVISLRRASGHNSPAPGSGQHEWHHRWVVRMHRVRQYYPSLGQHKIIYRGPYVKGPEDKPMLAGEVVRNLVR